jgi:hypothetical protein
MTPVWWPSTTELRKTQSENKVTVSVDIWGAALVACNCSSTVQSIRKSTPTTLENYGGRGRLRPEYHRSARCMSCRLRRCCGCCTVTPQTAFCIWATGSTWLKMPS